MAQDDSSESEARAMVNSYFQVRREEMEEMHDAFAIKTPYMTAVPLDEQGPDFDPSDQPQYDLS